MSDYEKMWCRTADGFVCKLNNRVVQLYEELQMRLPSLSKFKD